MDRKQIQQQRMTSTAQGLTTEIRRQVRGRWSEVRMAERNERGRHVWRFQARPGGNERFLHVEHRAMVRGKDPVARLLEQLDAERWLDRLEQGPETALLLSTDGQLVSYSRG